MWLLWPRGWIVLQMSPDFSDDTQKDTHTVCKREQICVPSCPGVELGVLYTHTLVRYKLWARVVVIIIINETLLIISCCWSPHHQQHTCAWMVGKITLAANGWHNHWLMCKLIHTRIVSYLLLWPYRSQVKVTIWFLV